MSSPPGFRTFFITGTDTGVGKTTLTSLLLQHLRRRGFPALALKPFCAGSRADAELLWTLQHGELGLNEINPFYFPEPVAPFVAGGRHRKGVPLSAVIHHIEDVRSRFPDCTHLLIEGAGGLLVPLGERYTVLDLIVALACEVVVVAANKLGTINHTLLTIDALRHAGAAASLRSGTTKTPRSRADAPARKSQRTSLTISSLVLMNQRRDDASSFSNCAVIRHFLPVVAVRMVPYLGPKADSVRSVKGNEKKLQKTLARILN